MDYDKTYIEQTVSIIRTRYKEHKNDTTMNEDKFSYMQHILKKAQICFTVQYTTQLDPNVQYV